MGITPKNTRFEELIHTACEQSLTPEQMGSRIIKLIDMLDEQGITPDQLTDDDVVHYVSTMGGE